MSELKRIANAVIEGDAERAKELTQNAVDAGMAAQEILNNGLLAGMGTIGIKFKAGEVFIPEVLLGAKALESGLRVLGPFLTKAGTKSMGKIALGTVRGDIHSIGKDLVAMMLKGAGFEVVDLGSDVPPERFVNAAKSGAQIIGMSALLTTTMPFMKTTIDALASAGLKGRAKTLIGGAVITQGYADEIGADGYAPDAVSAVDKAKELLGLV